MEKRKDYQVILLVVISILLNYAGKDFAVYFNLPVWLDSVGTILAAYYLGPICGAMVGAALNIMYGFQDSLAFIYMFINILTGVIAGVASMKDRFRNYFEVITTGSAIAIASTLFSTPLNYLINHGYPGNMWGDGIVNLLKEWRFHGALCYLAGEFAIDFVDKLITVLLVYGIVKLVEGKTKSKHVATLAIMALAGSLFFGSLDVNAAPLTDDQNVNYDTYVQKVYDGDDGLVGGEANDIAATKDGLLWIGTYSGLFRYNGTEFRNMKEFKSVKNVNCLYVDEEGRLWIGTNDNGLSICINQEISNVIDESVGLPSSSVRAIACGSDGNYYIGTSGELCVITLSSGIKIIKNIPEIVYARSIATDRDKNAVVITNSGEMFLLNEANIVEKKTTDFSAGYQYTACDFDENGRLYVATSSNEVEFFEIQDGKLVQTGHIVCDGIYNMNAITCNENGRVFISADSGAGYIYNNNYYAINTNSFGSSIENMIVDYQGNLWFASSRLGLLKMCDSPFVELFSEAGLEERVVNTVVRWGNFVYFGTDNGVEAVDYIYRKKVENEVTELLSTGRIRRLFVDSKNQLWACTSGDGLYEIKQDGSYRLYTEQEGTLGNKFRTCIEKSDGTLVIAGDTGITFIQDEKVVGTIGHEDGLTNAKILTLSELADGVIVAGSDGGGIFLIENGKVVDTITRENGLGSNVILRTVVIEEGILVVTGSDINFVDENHEIKQISSFPFNNNYDIITYGDKLWVLSSAGIYIVDKQELINDEIREYVLLDAQRGLRGTITSNSWNYVDETQNLYVSGGSGVNLINMNRYNDMTMKSYRMSVKNIKVDGVSQNLVIGENATIPRGTTKLEIFPEIINYSINNPYVMYYLEGFDDHSTIVPQSELTSLVYTNLPSKTYVFHLAVMDDERNNVVEELSYVIVKEKEIYDNNWFLIYATIVFVMAVAWITWFIVKTQVQKTINIQKKELELVRNQLRLGNETVLAIARTVDAKDENTSQHSVRVSEYAILIAKKLDYNEEQCENLRKTALLHDIGKIGIPDRVLNKPARLTDEEYEIMKSHVVRGGEILKDFTLIENVSDGALYHHERYDGKGYVHGLKGEEIPLNARIIGIADAFDAMTANRVYRKQLDFDFVVEELKKGRGTQFDPKLVDIMLDLIKNGEIDVESLYKEAILK